MLREVRVTKYVTTLHIVLSYTMQTLQSVLVRGLCCMNARLNSNKNLHHSAFFVLLLKNAHIHGQGCRSVEHSPETTHRQNTLTCFSASVTLTLPG